MSKDFFKVDKGLRLKGQSTEPANPLDGATYYDSVLKKFRFYQDGRWINLGAGNVEQALLYQLLSDNGMEDIAFDSFDGETTTLVNTTNEMDLNTADGNYDPTGIYQAIPWDGYRLPSSGEAGSTYVASVTGSSSVGISGGILTITDAADGVATYTSSLNAFTAGELEDADVVIESTMRIITETTGSAGADGTYSFGCGITLNDGARVYNLRLVRQTNSSGARKVVLTDFTTVALEFEVDWSEFHTYRLYKKADEGILLYVDGELVGKALPTEFATTSTRSLVFGSSGTAPTSISEWRELNYSASNSWLETKVLNYRGDVAFEGDGNPNSATSAGTVQESSSGFYLEDLWAQWSLGSAGTPTVTTVNVGTLAARRRIEQAAGDRISYSLALPDDGQNEANPVSIQATVYFEDFSLDGSFETSIGTIFTLETPNKSVRLQLFRGNSTTEGLIGLVGNGFTFSDSEIGTKYPIIPGESVNLELRKVQDKKYEFLVNGNIQQSVDYSDVGSIAYAGTSTVYWGLVANLPASTTLDWEWSSVRLTNNSSFLPRNPVREFIAQLDIDSREAFMSFSSDGDTWTFPQKIDASGVSELSFMKDAFAGGNARARLFMSNETDATLSNMAIMFNSSFGAAGLPSRYIKTFDSSELPSEPQDAVIVHNMGVAEDEIHVFGGTDFLIPGLDWYYNDGDSITIVGASSGVPYVILRVGFSFDRSQDNSSKITDLQNRTIYDSNTAAVAVADATTTDLNASITLTPGIYELKYGAILRMDFSVMPTGAAGTISITDTSNTLIQDDEAENLDRARSTIGRANVNTSFETAISSSKKTITTTTTIKLRGAISTTGGTVTNREILNSFISANKIGDF